MTTTAFVHGFSSTAMLIMAIGAQNAFVLRQGLRREHVLPVVALCALSDAVLLQAGVWGMGGVLLARPEWGQWMRWAGALFLLAYALQAGARALRPGQLLVTAGGPGNSLRSTVLTLLALTWLNPHVYLDTVVLVGAVGASQPVALRPLFLAGAGLASALWFAALGYGARLLTPLFARPAAWRVLDSGVAVLMFTIAWGLLRGLRM